MAELRIHKKIFQDYPTFIRGIVVAKGIQNRGHSAELESLLERVVGEACMQPLDLKMDPKTAVWREAHRQFGSNPNKFPPAHYALLKRIQKPGVKIPFINRVVAIMNYNSIVGVTPVGGDDLERAGQCLELCYATGNETFTPLGRPEAVEHPDPGEIIYVVVESGEVMCRRWNWRNGHHTRITEDTKTVVMNIDGLGEDSEARTMATRDRVAEMFETFCSAEVKTTMLSPSQASYEMTLP